MDFSNLSIKINHTALNLFINLAIKQFQIALGLVHSLKANKSVKFIILIFFCFQQYIHIVVFFLKLLSVL
jgi:hypothetical protein